MGWRELTAGMAGVLMALVTPAAEPQAELSGIWSATKEAPQDVEAAPTPILGQRFAVEREAGTLTLLRAGRDETIAAAFPGGGGEIRYRAPTGACRGDVEYVESAAWEGSTLVVTRTGFVPPGGGDPVKQNITFRLRPEGTNRLIVQSTISRGGEPKPVATVYRRSDEAMPAPRPGANVKKAPATIANVAWIAGTWIGATANGSVEERWTPAASGGMLGLGRTLRNTQMSGFEFLCISERDGSLIYSAMPNARSPATHFALTSVSADSATFENPGHDFPKVIRYTRRPDGSLETMIAGEGGLRPQTFVLKRQ